MKVSELGEFGLIDLLAKMAYQAQDKQAPAWQQLIIGIGDDAAAWQVEASTQLATVDSFIQDIHFSLDITPWEELGWKALAVNLSDIAAMGGSPRYAVVSLALPEHTEVEGIITLYQGMIELARQYGVAIVGGDTSNAPLIAINITVLGSIRSQDREQQSLRSQGENILTRSGAKAGDKIVVTGYLGAASAGWEMLTQKLQFDGEATECLKKAFLHPYPRITEGQLLLGGGIKAAIDISDGLISDLNHICQASRLGARVNVDWVPIHHKVKVNFGDRALELALSGGEDYELLFTGSAENINKIKEINPCPITVIGEMVASEVSQVTLVDSQGNPFKLQKGGWEHFKQTSSA
jgi:thiamine-monophosphate kinase